MSLIRYIQFLLLVNTCGTCLAFEECEQIRGTSLLQRNGTSKLSVMAFTREGRERYQRADSFELLLPIGVALALLGCYFFTRPEKSEPLERAPKAPAATAPRPALSSLSGLSPKRASRPAERRAEVNEICLCPSLVVPEKVECSILVPRLAQLQLSKKRFLPLCDMSGGTIFGMEAFPEKHLDGKRLILQSPSRERTFAYCKRNESGFSLHGQDTGQQAQLSAAEGCYLLTAQSRQTVRFRMSSPGSINASNEEGQLLAYSDAAAPDAEGVRRLLLKVGPKVDAGLMLLCFAAMELSDRSNS